VTFGDHVEPDSGLLQDVEQQPGATLQKLRPQLDGMTGIRIDDGMDSAAQTGLGLQQRNRAAGLDQAACGSKTGDSPSDHDDIR
jgi:hypothetical protein